MRRPYQLTALILLGLAAFVARESLRLRFYTSLGPGPGFFPFFLALLLAVLAVVMGLQATLGRGEPRPEDFFASRTGYLRMASVLVMLGAIAGLLQPLGFRLTMLGAILCLLWALGRPSLVLTALVSLVGSFGVYHVFVRWLQVPLPTGLLGL